MPDCGHMVSSQQKNMGGKHDKPADLSAPERRRRIEHARSPYLIEGRGNDRGHPVLASEASARDYGRDAEPQRYPDPISS